ncbi:hypothetical protein PV342_01580 [Streptomyces sp. PA03-3a]|nr:hypothetical protein [Streptomyces sp. PA03-3a]
MRPFVLVGVVCLVWGSAGCGSLTVSGTDGSADAAARMRKVAEAWEGSEAARSWREGFYPLEDVVRLPDNAFRTDTDKLAYLARNFEHRGPLPRTEREGRIRWADGTSSPVTPMTARETYDLIDDGPQGRADPLTVTKATFGEMTLLTSRGRARVPAWHFTLEGYDTPLVRAAVDPARLPRSPIAALSEATDDGWRLYGLRKVAGDGRSVTVLAGHGGCDDGPAVEVLETRDSVVLRGTVPGRDDGLCTKELLIEPVTVRLDRPLGGRLLLDSFTGAPMALAGR